MMREIAAVPEALAHDNKLTTNEFTPAKGLLAELMSRQELLCALVLDSWFDDDKIQDVHFRRTSFS